MCHLHVSVNMPVSDETIEILIDVVRQNIFLYDPQYHRHSDNIMVQNAWVLIARACDFEDRKCTFIVQICENSQHLVYLINKRVDLLIELTTFPFCS